jgi:phosphonate transport system substrate-binding protein
MKRAFATSLISVLLCLAASTPAPGDDVLRAGFLPVSPSAQLAARFTPLLDRLSEKTGRRFDFVTAPGFPAFMERAARGEYDLIWVPPHFARQTNLETGYEPLAAGGKKLVGVLLARRNGPGSARDVRNKTLALVDPQAFISLLVISFLEDKGLRADRDYRVRYFQTHPSAIEAVRRGSADLAGVSDVYFDQERSAGRADLVEIARTMEAPGMVFLAHPRLPEPTRRRIKDALLSMGESADGKNALERAKMGPLVPVPASDLKKMDKIIQRMKSSPGR